MSFSENWLSQRESFDAQARNKSIEIAVQQYFIHKSNLKIMDIGTGTGNNFFYYKDKFAADWLLIENNTILLNKCEQRIRKAGGSLVKNCQQKYILENHCIQMRWQSVDSISLRQIEDIDLIVANALFDLFSRNQFKQFCNTISSANTALCATLNYKSMKFLPEQPEDKKYIDLYEEHMRREQVFGRAMGAKCTTKMVHVLQNHFNYTVYEGDSDWILDSHKGCAMIDFLLTFMASSINELLPVSEKQDFIGWLEQKKDALKQKELNLHVFHTDIFAHPG